MLTILQPSAGHKGAEGSGTIADAIVDKRVFGTLDAMRGIAAIMVVLFHVPAADLGRAHPGLAYLSVDLFFVLSGFVLEAAYAGRLRAGMSWRAFMAVRLIRLWPLFALGTAIGLGFALWRFAVHESTVRPATVLAQAVTGFLLLPTPPRDWNAYLMPLDLPGWSLVLELVANAAFALWWPRLSNRVLCGVIAVAGVALIRLSVHHGSLDLGVDWRTLAGGFARVFFAFPLGVLLYRGYRGRVRETAWSALLPLALIGLFALPEMSVALDLALVLCLLPALVALGARLEAGPALERLFRHAGRISYPLYALHAPVIRILHQPLDRLHDRPVLLGVAIVGLIVLLIAASDLLDRHYDLPLRRALTRRMLGRRRDPARDEPAMSAP